MSRSTRNQPQAPQFSDADATGYAVKATVVLAGTLIAALVLLAGAVIWLISVVHAVATGDITTSALIVVLGGPVAFFGSRYLMALNSRTMRFFADRANVASSTNTSLNGRN